MNIYGIVAVSENNVVGVGQNIPWHLPEDFKYFKATTLDHYILMGKNTWLTFAKPLPRRKHVIISTSLEKEDLPNDALLYRSVDEAVEDLKKKDVGTLFIIGGGSIYKQTLPLMERVYLTRVHTEIENGTAFFPAIKKSQWTLISEEKIKKDQKHAHDFTFEVWQRK